MAEKPSGNLPLESWSLSLPTPPSEFARWIVDGVDLKEEELTQHTVTFTMPQNNVTFTASDKATGHTIKLNPNGGRVSPDTLTVKDGDTTVLPTPYRVGSYRFLGWFDENGDQVTAFTPITRDMTLTAHWQYTGGGTHMDPEEPEKPVEPTEPEGYYDVSVGDWYL